MRTPAPSIEALVARADAEREAIVRSLLDARNDAARLASRVKRTAWIAGAAGIAGSFFLSIFRGRRTIRTLVWAARAIPVVLNLVRGARRSGGR
jgi:hypothetical protein